MDYDYGDNWHDLADKCKQRYNYICQKCGKSFKENKIKLHAHHVIPLSKGGRNVLSNLIALCEDCHSKVHNKEIITSRRRGKSNAKSFRKF